MNRSWRPGDRVVSIAVRGLGDGVVAQSHFHGVTVLWSDGTRSLERLEDLVYLGRDMDFSPHALLDREAETIKIFAAPPQWAYGFSTATPEGTEADPADEGVFGSFGQDAAARQRQQLTNLYDDAFLGARNEAVADLTCAGVDPQFAAIQESLISLGIDMTCGRFPDMDWQVTETEDIGPYRLSALTAPESFSGYQSGEGQQTSGANDPGAASRFGIEIVLEQPTIGLVATDRLLEGAPFVRQIQLFREAVDQARKIAEPSPLASRFKHKKIGLSTVDHRWVPGDVVSVSRPGRRSGGLTTGHILRVHTSIVTIQWAPSATHPAGLVTQEKIERLIFVRHDPEWLKDKENEHPSRARIIPITATLAAESSPLDIRLLDYEWASKPMDPQIAGSLIPANATQGPSEIDLEDSAFGPVPDWVSLIHPMPSILGPETFDPLPASLDLRHRFAHSTRDGIIGDFE